jgi:hypothetical protein
MRGRFRLGRPPISSPPSPRGQVGLVDILMRYSWLKRLENLLLDPFLPGLSCQPPPRYAARLLHFAAFAAHPGPHPDPPRARARDEWLRRAGASGGGVVPEMGRKDLPAVAAAAAALFAAGALAAAAYRNWARRG